MDITTQVLISGSGVRNPDGAPPKPIFGDVPASRSAERRRSWHCLGPVDMPLEAKRFRHVAVAIPEVRVGRGIPVSPRKASPQPQQPDLAHRETAVGLR